MTTDTTTKYFIQHNGLNYWCDDDQAKVSDTFKEGVSALDEERGWQREKENAKDDKYRLIKRTETVFDV